MTNCPPNDIGSLVLNRATTSTSTCRQWTSFSASSLRRTLLNAFRCGGSSFSRHHPRGGAIPTEKPPEVCVYVSHKCADLDKLQRRRAAGGGKSEKLCDLLDQEEIYEREEYDVETKRKVVALEKLKRVVKDLQSDDPADGEKRRIAASEVRLLAKEDAESRATLAMLGSIPPLVGMLDCADDVDSQIAALYALLNLGIGNDENKAAIVKAGSIHKMLDLIASPVDSATNASVSDAVVANFLALSALDANKSIIGSSGAIPFLVNVLVSGGQRSSDQAKQDSLRAIYNLSILRSNVPFLLETDLVPFLFISLGDMDLSDRILTILSNIVAVAEGRKSIRAVKDAFGVLIDVLNWTDSPTCQEKVSYILMVMAHKSYGDRQAMIEAGIMSALLELMLLGSTLGQKRASRILECLRMDKGKEVSEDFGGASAPIYGSSSSASCMGIGGSERMEDRVMSEEKRAVKQLVQQSLQNNMRRIAKRANLPQDFVPSDHFMSIAAAGSTSKSLPF